MTYFGFLAIFLGIPLTILSLITVYDYRRGAWMPPSLHAFQPWQVIMGLCLVAFIYTTPWDNYLVATRVWWYDPALVSNIIFGWVPLEEYTFFILQPILTGLFWLWLVRITPIINPPAANPRIRHIATAMAIIVWVVSVLLLISTFQQATYRPLTYLSLELVWAMIPITIQCAFGADILWRHRRVVLLSIALTTLYLSSADFLAIESGTWTIDPNQSLNILLAGVLPIEEAIFFLITNTLVVFGMTLVLAQESQARADALLAFVRTKIGGKA